MGPKKGGGGQAKQRGNATEEVEETLQAVVLADTFETRFEPFTLEKPRVCCPSLNHLVKGDAIRNLALPEGSFSVADVEYNSASCRLRIRR
jgi:hypothetical protein